MVALVLLAVSGCAGGDEYSAEPIDEEYEESQEEETAETLDMEEMLELWRESMAETHERLVPPAVREMRNISENFDVRIYHSDPMANFWVYTPAVISRDNMVKDVREKITHLIDDFWYEGTHLIIDLKFETLLTNFIQGSTGAYFNTMGLVRTFATFPNVETLEVLIGGFRGMSGSHFDFNAIFIVEEDCTIWVKYFSDWIVEDERGPFKIFS
ncbi:MAG: hypothetical protein FWE04_03040 [Oscillospiraceae bacterium]|nr:hypothetical protein [Oscillospiraceae bacterium]